VRTAQITYYGEGPLNLQMRRFKSGKSVKARLDDILPDERRRYADRFLVVGADGVIINIGSMVPTEVAKLVIGVNPRVYKVPGFDVCIPPGYALDDSGADPMVVDAAVMAAKQTATAVKEPPREVNLKLVGDDEDELETGVVDGGIDEPEVPAEEAVVTVEVTDGPSLNEETPAPPAKKAVKKKAAKKRTPARKRAPAKKKAAAKKKAPAKKKSKADSLLEEF
jgi:hypothetical protein